MGKSNRAGGGYIVEIAEGHRGATRGLFYIRGKLNTPTPLILNKENQKRALEMLRDMGKSA